MAVAEQDEVDGTTVAEGTVSADVPDEETGVTGLTVVEGANKMSVP